MISIPRPRRVFEQTISCPIDRRGNRQRNLTYSCACAVQRSFALIVLKIVRVAKLKHPIIELGRRDERYLILFQFDKT